MTNCVDPDQTAPEEQSDLGLHCLPRPSCPNIKYFRVIQIFNAPAKSFWNVKPVPFYAF